MKIKSFLLLTIVGICIAHTTTQAELLIIKKENNQFAPLSSENAADIEAGKKIQEILLKYQWPMCIMSDLTEQEQDELLTSNKPFAEETFIQNKIKETLQNDIYHIVFIPTTLYELFCIYLTFKTKDQQTPLKTAVESVIVAYINRLYKPDKWEINLTKILNGENAANTIKKEVFNVYKHANSLFFDETVIKESENAFFYVNNQISPMIRG